MEFDHDNAKKVACTMAYHGISINPNGTLDPCCQYKQNYLPRHLSTPIMYYEVEKFNQVIRNAMHTDYAQGIRHKGCSKCYIEEDLGQKTLRTTGEVTIDTDVIQDMSFAETKLYEPDIYHIEMRLGNLCNLKCMMCGPRSSSSIAVERLQYEKDFRAVGVHVEDNVTSDSWWETEEFQKLQKKILRKARWINFTGGEPFMIPQVANWLDELLPHAKTNNVMIGFNTNLTKLSDDMVKRLSQFPRLMIQVSLEGIGRHNDYVRYPSRWKEIDINVKKLLTHIPNQSVSVNHTFQHASIYSLPDLSAWAVSHDLNMSFTMVQGHDALCLDSVPTPDLEKFRDWAIGTKHLHNEQRKFVINAIDAATFDIDLYNKFRNYVDLLDRIRGTNWNEVFQPYPVSIESAESNLVGSVKSMPL